LRDHASPRDPDGVLAGISLETVTAGKEKAPEREANTPGGAARNLRYRLLEKTRGRYHRALAGVEISLWNLGDLSVEDTPPQRN